jgi:hypothetical protein
MRFFLFPCRTIGTLLCSKQVTIPIHHKGEAANAISQHRL